MIVEPVAGNMNMLTPAPGFLEGLRALCDQYGAVLIFDEVMSGFRVHPGSAQTLYGVRPDLTTLGKIIGGGLPVGAFGGHAQIMAQLAPLGPVYQAGTLSGNPLAMAAGLATLRKLAEPGVYEKLERNTAELLSGLQAAATDHGIAFATQHLGSMFGLYFRDQKPTDYSQVMACDAERFKQFFHLMLDAGVYLAPSAFEAGFVSARHDADTHAATLSAARSAFAAMAGN